MKIAMIGAGRVGTALGTRWSEAGHDVVYGVRDPADERHTGLSSVDTVELASRSADVVLIALPWAAVEEVLTPLEVGDAVVIDATNPLAANARELQGHPELSGAQLVSQWIDSKRVVKAFNTTGSSNMVDCSYAAGKPVMPVAGDDEAAKQVATDLAEELGFEAIDAGDLTAAADLEHLAMIWIRLAYPLGHGPDFAFSVMRR